MELLSIFKEHQNGTPLTFEQELDWPLVQGSKLQNAKSLPDFISCFREGINLTLKVYWNMFEICPDIFKMDNQINNVQEEQKHPEPEQIRQSAAVVQQNPNHTEIYGS